MCTFGVLGLSCEAPAAPKPPEFSVAGEGKKKERNFGLSGGGLSSGGLSSGGLSSGL